jgi:hypothetical protein
MTTLAAIHKNQINHLHRTEIIDILNNLNKIFPNIKYDLEFMLNIIHEINDAWSSGIATIHLTKDINYKTHKNTSRIDFYIVSNLYDEIFFIIEDIELFLYLCIKLLNKKYKVKDKSDTEVLDDIQNMMNTFQEEKLKYSISSL